MWTQSASATIFCSSNTLPMCMIIEWEWAEQRAREDQELQDTLSKKHSLEFPWGENSFPSLSEFTREHEVRPFFPKYARNLISVLYWWDSMPVTTVLFGYVFFLRSTFLIASTRQTPQYFLLMHWKFWDLANIPFHSETYQPNRFQYQCRYLLQQSLSDI